MTNELTYIQNGDYLIPNLTLSEPPEAAPLGRYGRMRKDFLEKHRPILFQKMLLEESLYPHLREIGRDRTAEAGRDDDSIWRRRRGRRRR